MLSLRSSSKLANSCFRSSAVKTMSFSRNHMRMLATGKLIYTETDEAPALATYSLLPVVKTYANMVDIEVEKSDISLAARIIAQFPKYLTDEQRMKDTLAELGEVAKTPEANIIKLPNISASIPQLNAAIDELRLKGYDVPKYVPNPRTEKEKVIHARYAKVLGSAVNPVLREGNSDRRVAAPVKNYAKKNPHILGSFSKASRSHVAHMTKGDFYGTEQSHIMPAAGSVNIEFVGKNGTKMMREGIELQKGEVIDASCMSMKELNNFLDAEIEEAAKEHILMSVHLKATMMKISDPVIFGRVVYKYFQPVYDKFEKELKELQVNPNNGFKDLLTKITSLPQITQDQIHEEIEKVYSIRPWLAMVDSAKGVTNLHTPSDVIIDASMPVVIRDSGKMWNADGELEDVKCIIPDRCYATIYQEIMSFCKHNGQFDVATMGNVANVGLMAQKAEEYGSHDKTFIVPEEGTMRVVDSSSGKVIFSHEVGQGDIWRMCQTKDAPIRDWVRLAVSRARATGNPAIFWLDDHRAHDKNLISLVKTYLKDHNTDGLNISIQSPVHAMRTTCERAKDGLDTISVTGNVLRDYLTDLFPILELGTSAKMLSIVPLLAGGGLFETGAGGSAPKHVDQFLKEGHLRWDSLGEYLAIAVSLEHMADTTGNKRAKMLGESLNQAIERLLENRKSPGRKVNQLDNRASNFYIALYWAEFMAMKDPAFQPIATKLKDNRKQVVAELKVCQGKPQDVGGYYKFDQRKVSAAMQPSPTFNKILNGEL